MFRLLLQRNKELLLWINFKAGLLTNKELFRLFSEKNRQILPFSMDYNWWNEVVKDNWDVAVVGNKNSIKAIWPYYIRKKGIWTFIANPHFTPYTGPFLIYPTGQKADTKISYENKIFEDLIQQLPKFSDLLQHFHLQFKNSLPFLWNGFSDEKRFTYLLNLVLTEKEIWEGFRENTRREIRKAEKSLKVVESKDPSILENLLKQTYEKQIDTYPNFPSALFSNIINYINKYNNGNVLAAIDDDNNTHAAILYINDAKSAYYLIGGTSTEFKNSGAMSLLMWESIKLSKQSNIPYFNFEGSNIRSIEKYLRGFGGELTSFSRITKKNSTSLETLKKFK